MLGKNIYVGLSTRSNPAAIEQIQNLLNPFGYTVMGVQLHDCLHLKSAVTQVDEQTILINPAWVDTSRFKSFNWIEVHASEPYAANCLPINGHVIYPTSFPKTFARLEKHGCRMLPVNVDELAKAEGAVTCCSLILSI
jgi:dimethylargininase